MCVSQVRHRWRHRWGLHTIREEQFNTTLLCKEPSIHAWVTPEGGQISICFVMTCAYHAVGCGELCASSDINVSPTHWLVRRHSGEVVLHCTLYMLACVSAA